MVGNKAVGSGTQEIVASTPDAQVKSKLTFAGFDTPSMATFDLERAQDGVRVTWSMDLPLGGNPLMHYLGVLIKKQVAPDYELGLKRLKALAEGGSKTDFGGLEASLADSKPIPYAYVSASSSTDTDAIGKALMGAYGQVGVFMKATGLKQAGAPLAVTRRWDDEAKVYDFDAGIPVDRDDVTPPAPAKGAPEVKLAKTYAGTALKVMHHGAYRDLPKTYEKIAVFKAAYGLEDNGSPWEQYVSDPGNMPEAQLVTEIWLPVK
jgi:effector-binding domain-containing protein